MREELLEDECLQVDRKEGDGNKPGPMRISHARAQRAKGTTHSTGMVKHLGHRRFLRS